MKSEAKTKISVLSIAYISLFVAVITICAWINVPLIVPFTLQTFAVFTAIGLLGTRRSALCVLVYILLGAVGVPVFANFGGGLNYLFGYTGGYIIGFIITCLVTGPLIKLSKGNALKIAASMILGLVVCYAFGTAWFMIVYSQKSGHIGLLATLSMCVFPYIIPDLVKIALATLLVKRLSKYVH